MHTVLLDFLKTYKRKTIPLHTLQEVPVGDVAYEAFARTILQLCEDNILIPMKSGGENRKNPSLPFQFRINSAKLTETHRKRIHAVGLNLYKEINLTNYFSLSEQEFEKDLPYIMKVSAYLKENGLPQALATSAERSYQLFDDEKVIDEHNGRRILERMQLFEKMKINYETDPAMFFLNKESLYHNKTHYHLIVENRTTFYCLSDCLQKVPFTSLIYGCGFKMIAGIDMVEKQLNLTGHRHIYYYFGDLDNTGILIWYILHKKNDALPALPFYTSLLRKKFFHGKENQKRNDEATACFQSFFSPENASFIENMLHNGGYYPQETLTRDELHKIWSENDWTFK